MHPSDREWWITHSGDYVLGLLSDADRLVFERILQIDPEVQELVREWREHLQPMSDALTPIEPPDQILASLLVNLPQQPAASPAYGGAHPEGSPLDGLDDAPVSEIEAEEQAAKLADGTAFQRLLDHKQVELDQQRGSADGWRGFAGLITVACIGMASWGWMASQ